MNDSKKISLKDKFEKWLKWIRIGYLTLIPVYVFIVAIYKGIPPYSEPKSIQSIILGIFLAFFVFAILFFADFGISAWDKSTTWLAKFMRKYPVARRVAVIPLAIATPILGVNISFLHWQLDSVTRVIFFVYTVIIFPAAILSIIKDERVREYVRLSKQITPELISSNSQAAIENAFTYFEDYLRKRLDVTPQIYGEELINLAFGKDGKLLHSEVDNENKGVRNFVSGAYATFRNPRKHRVVQDDEQMTHIIINIVESLIKIVDESKDREQVSDKAQS